MKYFTILKDDIENVGLVEALIYNEIVRLTYCFELTTAKFTTDFFEQYRLTQLPFITQNSFNKSIEKLIRKKLITVKDSIIHVTHTKPTKERSKIVRELPTAENDTLIEFLETQEDGSKKVISMSENKLINDLIDGFKTVNPNYGSFFSRKNYRNDLKEMLRQYPVTDVINMVKILEKTNAMPYAPIITNPGELIRLAPKLIAFLKKFKVEQAKNNSIKELW